MVLTLFYLRNLGLVVLFPYYRHVDFFPWLARLVVHPIAGGFLPPGLAVHFWLPFLALCIVFLKALNLLRMAVGRTQSFLKGRTEHPLDAIGYVAAALVFAGASVLRLAGVID
jgi:hypothetical protein